MGASQRRRKMPPRAADYKLQVIIIGSRGVGKTSLMERFTDDTFCEACKSTVGKTNYTEIEAGAAVSLDGEQQGLSVYLCTSTLPIIFMLRHYNITYHVIVFTCSQNKYIPEYQLPKLLIVHYRWIIRGKYPF